MCAVCWLVICLDNDKHFLVGHFLESMEGNIKCSQINVEGEVVRNWQHLIKWCLELEPHKEHSHMLFSPYWSSSKFIISSILILFHFSQCKTTYLWWGVQPEQPNKLYCLLWGYHKRAIRRPLTKNLCQLWSHSGD